MDHSNQPDKSLIGVLSAVSAIGHTGLGPSDLLLVSSIDLSRHDAGIEPRAIQIEIFSRDADGR